jgi:hypothetical protein
VIDVITSASVVSGVVTIIRIYLRLRHVDKRNKREKERYKYAARQCTEAYYQWKT